VSSWPSDEVTGPQAAHILSEILGRLVTHPQTMPAPLTPMAPWFRWLAGTGFHADIRQLRSRYPGDRLALPCSSGRPDTTGLT